MTTKYRHKGCIGDGCHHCAAYAADPVKYAPMMAVFGFIAHAARRGAAGDCVHRGATLRVVVCPTCAGSVKAKVDACALHGECTRFARPIHGVRACAGCPDRADPPAPDGGPV